MCQQAGIPLLLAASAKGALDRDWSQPGATQEALEQLTQQLDALVTWLSFHHGALMGLPPVSPYVRVLAQLIQQDLEPDPDPANDELRLDTALLSAHGVGVEMGYIKARYGAHFRAALVDAIASLAALQRELLRLHFGEGQIMDQLAALLGLHRATAARRVQAAAQAAFAATRRLLKEGLKLGSQEFESLVTLLRSQLDLSISRVLGPATSDLSDR